MNRFITLAIPLLLLCSAAGSQGATLEAQLLRTVQIGNPQGVTTEQIKSIVQDPKTSFLTLMLSRSALLVLQRDDPEWESFDNLLSSVLNTPLGSGNEYPQPVGLASRFGGKELVFTMVYALVMSGKQERAVQVLEQHLSTGGQFKQAIVLQALRNIGTQRAKGLIQKYHETRDHHNLAENTLSDEDLPVLAELYDRWNVVPPRARLRTNLSKIVQGGCGEREGMAAYWLGFFPSNPEPRQEQAELAALRALYQNDSARCDFTARLIAIKSLGLRSAESMDYWATLLRKEPQLWLRHQILIDAFGHYGRQFAPAALELLSTEPSQYIQWQLMQGNIECRQGQRFRNYWDIWIPVTLQFSLVFPDPGHREKMSAADQNDLLHWLESGRHPQDRVVLNHMLYALVSQTQGRDTARLLTVFNDLPDRSKNWWMLTPLEDASALPLLNYYATLPAPKDQREQLVTLIRDLQRTHVETQKHLTCCQPTEGCLRSMLGEESSWTAAIRSEAQARAWLTNVVSSKVTYQIKFSGPLQRIATVHRAGKVDQRWEYLYDCWHRTDATASRVSK